MLVATCLICLQLHYKSPCQQRMHIIYGHLWGTCMHMPLGAPKTSTMWFKPLSTRHPNSTNLGGCLQLQGEAISVRLLVYLSTWTELGPFINDCVLADAEALCLWRWFMFHFSEDRILSVRWSMSMLYYHAMHLLSQADFCKRNSMAAFPITPEKTMNCSKPACIESNDNAPIQRTLDKVLAWRHRSFDHQLIPQKFCLTANNETIDNGRLKDRDKRTIDVVRNPWSKLNHTAGIIFMKVAMVFLRFAAAKQQRRVVSTLGVLHSSPQAGDSKTRWRATWCYLFISVPMGF